MHPPLVVIKFGGTSLASPARLLRAARRIQHHLRQTEVVVVANALGHTTDRILAWVGRREIPPGLAAREIDRALATGETLSTSLLAAAIRALNLPAKSLIGGEAGIEANGQFGAASVTRVNPSPIRRLLCNGGRRWSPDSRVAAPTGRRSRWVGAHPTPVPLLWPRRWARYRATS